MGLNAVVYMNINNLDTQNKVNGIKIDNYTGEVFFEDSTLSRNSPVETFVATSKRLGNIEEIANLRKEFSKNHNQKSILISKVLYDGSHSGDIISLDCLHSLKQEIDNIKATLKNSASPEIETFLASMNELVESALKQGNPIVFI